MKTPKNTHTKGRGSHRHVPRPGPGPGSRNPAGGPDGTAGSLQDGEQRGFRSRRNRRGDTLVAAPDEVPGGHLTGALGDGRSSRPQRRGEENLSVSGSCEGSCSGSSSSRPLGAGEPTNIPPGRGGHQPKEGKGEWAGELFDETAGQVDPRTTTHAAQMQQYRNLTATNWPAAGSRSQKLRPELGPGPSNMAEGEGEYCVSQSLSVVEEPSPLRPGYAEAEVTLNSQAVASGSVRSRSAPHRPRQANSATAALPKKGGSRGTGSNTAPKMSRRRQLPAGEAKEQQSPPDPTPIHTLSNDLLAGIFQKLSTSEWRSVIPLCCSRWRNIVAGCGDLWAQVEVCPFENSGVIRRVSPNHPEDNYWQMGTSGQMWLASSSLSRDRVLQSLLPQARHVQALLLSCLSLTLAPAASDNGDEDSNHYRRIVRASDFQEQDLVQIVRAMRGTLRHFMIRVSGHITTPVLIAEVCQAPNLELLHAEVGNVEIDCSVIAPLKCLTSLRLRRDELSLSLNEGSMKLINLHRLSECTELTRLSLGLDTHLDSLPSQIFKLDKLRNLEVDRCSNMGQLPSGISMLTGLHTLSLAGSSSLPSLPPEMKSLAQLVSLNLDFCTQMSYLPEEIGSLSNLQMLSMEGGYAIFDDGVPFEIGLCSNLQSLVLADTHILSLPMLGRKLAPCTNLQSLYLDHNDDLQIESYPEEIMALPKLCTLSMRKYERHSWSVISTRHIAKMQEEATQLRLQKRRVLQILL